MSAAADSLRHMLLADMAKRPPVTFPADRLQFCEDCHQASVPLSERCHGCGSKSVMNLSRILTRAPERRGA